MCRGQRRIEWLQSAAGTNDQTNKITKSADSYVQDINKGPTMRIRTIITISAALMLTAGAARAAHIWEDSAGWWDGHFAYDVNAPRYTAQELSLDLFGSYINPEQNFIHMTTTSIRRGWWGGGAGLNYFFLRNVGIGTDFNVSAKPENTPAENNLVDYWVGNIYLRLPIGNTGLSPYIYGGGGRGISPIWQWVYGGGAGLEYRFNPTTGVFVDGRFLWANKPAEAPKDSFAGTDVLLKNRLVIRAGLRVVF
jgi:hypothetical protein